MPKNPIQKEKRQKNWLLYSGIKNLLRSDNAEIVQEISRYVISQYKILQVSTSFIERKKGTVIPAFTAFLSGVTRFLEVRADNENGQIVWVGRYENERREIEKLHHLIPELKRTQIKFRRRPTMFGIATLLKKFLPNWRRLFRIARLVHKKHQYFSVFRVTELISYYIHYLAIFEKNNFKVAIVSNHSNPHGIAFNLAARKFDIPVILVTHGMPIRPVVKLSYDLAIVHCEKARQIYLEEGCKLKQVLVQGRKQDHKAMPEFPLPKNLKIGIFLCKDVNEIELKSLVNYLLSNSQVSEILIRPHPKNLWVEFDAWIEMLDNTRVQVSIGKNVIKDLENVDIVFGGNSSVLVDAVLAGRPAVYLSDIDHGSYDLHQFVAEGLIYEDNKKFDFDDILSFYLRPEWSKILTLFANVFEEKETVLLKIDSTLQKLTG